MKKFLTDQYFIPNYQREYSWTQNELEDFWYDLNETKNDESEYSTVAEPPNP